MNRHWKLAAALTAALMTVAVVPLLAKPKAKKPASRIKAVTPDELKAAIAAQQGKVVLINVWATWCPPCRAEFPDVVKLDAKYGKAGLVILAVSVDQPADLGKVKQFIKEHKARFAVFTSKTDDLGSYLKAVDPDFGGAIPVTYVLGKDGKRVGAPLVGLHSYEAFAAAVEPALK